VQSSLSPLPGLQSHAVKPPDLGPVLRHSRGANATVGEFGEACYALGGVDGYELGTSHGYFVGHAAGWVECSVALCSGFGVVMFVLMLVVLLYRRKPGEEFRS
jgi:hypothetical protein